MGRLIEGMKVRSVCEALRLDRDTAMLMVQIHTLTKGGSLGQEYFMLSDGESLEARLGPFAMIQLPGNAGNQFNSVKRMFNEPEYRGQMYDLYQSQVQPRAAKYSVWDIFRR